MIDRPYPSNIKEEEVVDYIDYRKDVDGITTLNQGLLNQNRKCLLPPTANSCYELINHYVGSVEGKKALVIGRSSSVGRPLAQILLNNNATVTIAHSRTKNLKELAKKKERKDLFIFICCRDIFCNIVFYIQIIRVKNV